MHHVWELNLLRGRELQFTPSVCSVQLNRPRLPREWARPKFGVRHRLEIHYSHDNVHNIFVSDLDVPRIFLVIRRDIPGEFERGPTIGLSEIGMTGAVDIH